MKKKHLIFSFILILLFSLTTVRAALDIKYFSEEKISDQQLKDLAVEKLYIPYDADKAYNKSELDQKNTVSIWIMMERKKKIELIDTLKKMWLEKENTVIRLPASHYVDELNGVIYNNLSRENGFEELRRGLGAMFKTIALMDGDYDNGKSMVETLRNYSGEDLFEYFKVNFPDKYEKLVKLDKERGR